MALYKYYYFWSTQHKAVGVNIVEVKQSVNGCNKALSRDHGVPEKDLIPLSRVIDRRWSKNVVSLVFHYLLLLLLWQLHPSKG